MLMKTIGLRSAMSDEASRAPLQITYVSPNSPRCSKKWFPPVRINTKTTPSLDMPRDPKPPLQIEDI
jgi:hypothetical protein